MTCGDTQAQWVNALLGSTWAGTIGDQSAAAVFLAVDSVAVITADAIPLVGTWEFQDGQLLFSVATEGISYEGQVSATTCGGTPSKVTAATGGAGDAFGAGHSVALTRVL